MEHPSARIWLDDLTYELLNTNIEVNLGADKVVVRQFTPYVIAEQSHIRGAKLWVSIRGRDIPRSIRFPVSKPVAWGVKYESISQEVRVAGGETPEKWASRAVHQLLCTKHTDTLDAGQGYPATVFYTIKGSKSLFLATENAYEFPLGRTYRFHLYLVGEGLSYPTGADVYVEADNWNKIYTNYDYVYIRVWRRIRKFFMKSFRKKL